MRSVLVSAVLAQHGSIQQIDVEHQRKEVCNTFSAQYGFKQMERQSMHTSGKSSATRIHVHGLHTCTWYMYIVHDIPLVIVCLGYAGPRHSPRLIKRPTPKAPLSCILKGLVQHLHLIFSHTIALTPALTLKQGQCNYPTHNNTMRTTQRGILGSPHLMSAGYHTHNPTCYNG